MIYATPVVKLIPKGLWACSHHPLRSLTARRQLHCVNRNPPRPNAPSHRPKLFNTLATEKDGDRNASESLSYGVGRIEVSDPVDKRLRSAHESLRNISSTTKWDLPPELILELEIPNPATPTKDLYAILAKLCGRGHLQESYKLIEYLITDRNIRINQNVFKLLIASNISTSGSVANVMNLMEQMRLEDIPLDQTVYQKILQVLAIHPDYVLRTAVLQQLEQNWQGLTELDHHWVVAGLLRDLQLERALEMLETMNRNGLQIHTWLYDMTAYILISLQEFEEALRVVRMRIQDKGPSMLIVLWSYLIDSAAEALHYEACAYVWSRQVIPRYVVPSSGTCLKVLSAAARHGDTALAKDIFLLLNERDTELDDQHYEMVVEAYASAGDINGALGVVCEMNAIGISTDHHTTRPIYRSLLAVCNEANQSDNSTQRTERIQNLTLQAFGELEKLTRRGVRVPTAAANVLIEAAGKKRGLEAAFYMYENLQTVCPDGPDTETFYHLLETCRKFSRLDLVTDLARDIAEMDLQLDIKLYDSLILALLSQTTDRGEQNAKVRFENAYRYYEEMDRLGLRPSQKTITLIYARLRDASDPRADGVLQDVARLFPTAGPQPKLDANVDDENEDIWESFPSERAEGMARYVDSARIVEGQEEEKDLEESHKRSAYTASKSSANQGIL